MIGIDDALVFGVRLSSYHWTGSIYCCVRSIV